MQIVDIMTPDPVSVSADATALEVIRLFERHGFHHVLVVENDKLIGVISDRDILKHVSPFVGAGLTERPQDMATLDEPVAKFMTKRLYTIPTETPVEEAAILMLHVEVSCLPVLDANNRAVGIVTWRDLLRSMVLDY